MCISCLFDDNGLINIEDKHRQRSWAPGHGKYTVDGINARDRSENRSSTPPLSQAKGTPQQ